MVFGRAIVVHLIRIQFLVLLKAFQGADVTESNLIRSIDQNVAWCDGSMVHTTAVQHFNGISQTM